MGLSKRQTLAPFDVLAALKASGNPVPGLDADLLDGKHAADFVDVMNDQGIVGQKSFAQSPIVPEPTADMYAANKGYVDSAIATVTGDESNGPGDHNALTNRGMANQHPTSAITGLDAKLATIPTLPGTGTDGVSGLTKLYGTTGNNSDGAMTQAAASTALAAIPPLPGTGTDSVSGLTKLYGATGNNSDGAMTQAAASTQLSLLGSDISILGGQIDALDNDISTLGGQIGDLQSNKADLVSGNVPQSQLPIASTSASGIVQLNDSTSSNSTTQAATANAVSQALAAALAASIPCYKNRANITSSGNWTVPANVTQVGVLMIGGGGGGGAYCGGGGGGGGIILRLYVAVTPGQSMAAVIGSGGSGATTAGSGSAGGNTTFAGLTAYGGNVGASANASNGGRGGSGGAGDLRGQSGGSSLPINPTAIQNAGGHGGGFGGGTGAVGSLAGVAPNANTGGGGGGGPYSAAGNNGGSGLVTIFY